MALTTIKAIPTMELQELNLFVSFIFIIFKKEAK